MFKLSTRMEINSGSQIHLDTVFVSHIMRSFINVNYKWFRFGSADFYPNKGAAQPGCPLRNRLTNLIGNVILMTSENHSNPNLSLFFIVYRKMFTRSFASFIFGEFEVQVHSHSMYFVWGNQRWSMHIQQCHGDHGRRYHTRYTETIRNILFRNEIPTSIQYPRLQKLQ